MDRRGFLAGLIGLPVIGKLVKLNPTGPDPSPVVEEPVVTTYPAFVGSGHWTYVEVTTLNDTQPQFIRAGFKESK